MPSTGTRTSVSGVRDQPRPAPARRGRPTRAGRGDRESGAEGGAADAAPGRARSRRRHDSPLARRRRRRRLALRGKAGEAVTAHRRASSAGAGARLATTSEPNEPTSRARPAATASVATACGQHVRDGHREGDALVGRDDLAPPSRRDLAPPPRRRAGRDGGEQEDVASDPDAEHPPARARATCTLRTRMRKASVSMSKRAPSGCTVPVRRATRPSTASRTRATDARTTSAAVGAGWPVLSTAVRATRAATRTGEHRPRQGDAVGGREVTSRGPEEPGREQQDHGGRAGEAGDPAGDPETATGVSSSAASSTRHTEEPDERAGRDDTDAPRSTSPRRGLTQGRRRRRGSSRAI